MRLPLELYAYWRIQELVAFRQFLRKCVIFLTICARKPMPIRIYLGYLTSAGPESLSSQPSRTDSSFGSSDARKNVSGFKIMSVTRGFTEEADKLLDYLVSFA